MSDYNAQPAQDSDYHSHSLTYANYGVFERAGDVLPESVREHVEGTSPSANYQTQLSRESVKHEKSSGSMVAEMMPGPHPRYYLPDNVFYERLNFD